MKTLRIYFAIIVCAALFGGWVEAGFAQGMMMERGGKAYRVFCTNCHDLPDPSQLTPREWPAAVERMKKYMERLDRPVPSRKEMHLIIGFLQQHSHKPEESPGERSKP